MHMEAAVKTPVVAIFGPQDRFRWGSWVKVILLFKSHGIVCPVTTKTKDVMEKAGVNVWTQSHLKKLFLY